MRKRTHEEFIKLMQDIHPNIEVLGTYVNSQTKIKCKCKLDEHEWTARPNDLLNGHGCPKCMKITHDKFIQRFNKLNPYANDIEVLGTYVNVRTKIKCKCKLDGHIWEATPSNLLSGTGCPKCGEKRIAQKQSKTHEQFMEDLQEINPDIQVLGTYVNAHNKIKCKCKICGHIWKAQPSNLLNGTGCPICAINNNRKTHHQFIQELQQINTDIEVLGTYVNSKTKIKCRCKLDGYEWEAKPSNLLIGQGCPKCAGNLQKTHEEFIKDLQQVNSDIEVLGTYKNGHTKIKCKCKLDGYEWKATPNSLLQGQGCPKCSTSKGEKRIAQYLDNLGIDYIYDKRYFKHLVSVNGGLMRPDFIIPTLKIWIEYDGQQHFKPVDFTSKMSEEQVQAQFKQVQQNDQIKNQYAEQHNWTLIRIPYWDFDNIEQILDSYLKQEEELAL